MKRVCMSVALLTAWLVLADSALGQGKTGLAVAQGKVLKVDKDKLVIQPSGPSARSIIYKLTGTSKFTTMTVRVTGGKTVFVQRDTSARELRPNQMIAVIATASKGDSVLLSAVVLPAGK